MTDTHVAIISATTTVAMIAAFTLLSWLFYTVNKWAARKRPAPVPAITLDQGSYPDAPAAPDAAPR